MEQTKYPTIANRNGKVKLRVKEILQETNTTQKKLADLTGLSPNAISNLCGDTSSVNFSTLEALINGTGIALPNWIAHED